MTVFVEFKYLLVVQLAAYDIALVSMNHIRCYTSDAICKSSYPIGAQGIGFHSEQLFANQHIELSSYSLQRSHRCTLDHQIIPLFTQRLQGHRTSTACRLAQDEAEFYMLQPANKSDRMCHPVALYVHFSFNR